MAKRIKPEQLGTYLRKKQEELQLNDQLFSERLGITRVSLRALKNGRYLPKLKTLPNLGLSLEYLVLDFPAVAPKKAPKKATK